MKTTKAALKKEYQLHRRNFSIRTSVALTATRYGLTRLETAEALGLGPFVIQHLDKPLDPGCLAALAAAEAAHKEAV